MIEEQRIINILSMYADECILHPFVQANTDEFMAKRAQILEDAHWDMLPHSIVAGILRHLNDTMAFTDYDESNADVLNEWQRKHLLPAERICVTDENIAAAVDNTQLYKATQGNTKLQQQFDILLNNIMADVKRILIDRAAKIERDDVTAQIIIEADTVVFVDNAIDVEHVIRDYFQAARVRYAGNDKMVITATACYGMGITHAMEYAERELTDTASRDKLLVKLTDGGIPADVAEILSDEFVRGMHDYDNLRQVFPNC